MQTMLWLLKKKKEISLYDNHSNCVLHLLGYNVAGTLLSLQTQNA